MKELIRDLAEEYESLDGVVSPLAEEQWARKTPFASWTVRDEIGHLAFFDGAARLTAADPGGFSRHLAEMATLPDPFEDTLARGRRSCPGGDRKERVFSALFRRWIRRPAWPGMAPR